MAENYNLLDYARQFGPDSKEYSVAKVLAQSNPILQDAVMIESNSDSGHEYAIQTGLPTATWRKAYQGVQPSKSTRKVVKETFGVCSEVSAIDKIIAEKGGNIARVRASEAEAHLESMSQAIATKMIYGSEAATEEAFVGLAARYNKISTDKTKSGYNIISAGSSTSGSMCSIWIIGWGEGKIFTFAPKGSKSGIETIDYSANGPIDIVDSAGGSYPGYKEQFECKIGLGVQDWRYAVRIPNILLGTTTADNLRKLVLNGLDRIYNLALCKPVIYCNRECKSLLREAQDAKSNVWYDPKDPNARPVFAINDVPVKTLDCLVNTEATVS